MQALPEKIETILKLDEQIEGIAEQFKDSRNFLYLGRGVNFPVALEGALKLKEISYIHAEGYPAGGDEARAHCTHRREHAGRIHRVERFNL